MYFESDTIKSDCPVQILRKLMKYQYRLMVYITSLLFFSRDFKINKKNSKNDQSTAPPPLNCFPISHLIEKILV